jgi:hypothetical protein
MVVVVGILLEQVLMAQSAFKLGRMRTQVTRAEGRHEELMLQATKLESPTRIEGFARTRLGMVDPDPATTQYVVADLPHPRGVRLARAPRAGRLPATGEAASAPVEEAP